MAFKFCPECGFKLNGEYKFCPECGYKLSGESAFNIQVENEFVEPISDEIFDTDIKNDDSDFDFSGLESAFDSQIEQKESEESEYENLLVRAKTYCLRGKYLMAEEIYKELLKKDPEDINANIGMLRVVSKNLTEYNFDKAETQLNFLLKLYGKETLINYGLEMENFFKVKEKYKLDFNLSLEKARVEAEFDNARFNLKTLLKAKINSREGLYREFGVYPQSLKQESVKILPIGKDEENGYFVGSDYNYYEQFNGKYFKVEPIKWAHIIGTRNPKEYYPERTLDYTTFGDGQYSESELRKFMIEFYDKAKLSNYPIQKNKYSSPWLKSVIKPLMKRVWESFFVLDTLGSIGGKDSIKIYEDYVVAPIVDQTIYMYDSSFKPYTDYALERYRVLVNDMEVKDPKGEIWTRTHGRYTYQYCVRNVNRNYEKFMEILNQGKMTELSSGEVAGVKPVVQIKVQL